MDAYAAAERTRSSAAAKMQSQPPMAPLEQSRSTSPSVLRLAADLGRDPADVLLFPVQAGLTLSRHVGRGRAASPGLEVALQFNKVGTPALAPYFRELERHTAPPDIAQRLTEAARQKIDHVTDAEDILIDATAALGLMRGTALHAKSRAEREAAKAVRLRILESLCQIHTDEAPSHWRTAEGLYRFLTNIDGAYEEPDCWFALFTNPEFSTALDQLARCWMAARAEHATMVLSILLRTTAKMMRVLPLERAATALEQSIQPFMEQLRQNQDRQDRFEWTDDESRSALQALEEEALHHIETDLFSLIGDSAQWSPELRGAIRSALAQGPTPKVCETLQKLVQLPRFQEIDRRWPRYAGSIAFSMGIMAYVAQVCSNAQHAELLNNTIQSILDGVVPLARHYYGRSRTILGRSGDDGVSLNEHICHDTGFEPLSKNLRSFARAILPHEVFHFLDEETDPFKREYHAKWVGHLAEFGSPPNARKAADIAIFLLFARTGYPRIYSTWRVMPHLLDDVIRDLFHCDPRELQGLSQKKFRARAQQLVGEGPAPWWSSEAAKTNTLP